MSALLSRLAEARKEGNVARLAEAIPYARWMQIAPENGTGELLTRMRYHPELIGNTFLPAIHGGTLGAMLEMAAMKTTLFAMKIVTAKKGASMITSWTAVTVAGGTAPSELAAWAVTVLAAPNLVRTLWLNFHLPKFVFRN